VGVTETLGAGGCLRGVRASRVMVGVGLLLAGLAALAAPGVARANSIDREAIHAAVRETGAVITVEEHSIVGGLGGAAAEVLAEVIGPRAPLKRIGLPSVFAPRAGSRDYLAHEFGISEQAILATLRQTLHQVTANSVQGTPPLKTYLRAAIERKPVVPRSLRQPARTLPPAKTGN